jgi:hypothetical protein
MSPMLTPPNDDIPHARHRRDRELSASQQQQVIRCVTEILQGKRRAVVFTSDGVQIREEVTGSRFHPRDKVMQPLRREQSV